MLTDPHVRVVYDDARHFVLTTHEKFDIITSDPIHPWVKGAATLYTREYFQMCKDHLNPGGLVTQWVPLYESTEETVKAEIATFFAVFPNGTIWGNDIVGQGYDVVLMGCADKTMKIDIDVLQNRLDRKEFVGVTASLDEVNLGSATILLATYAGQAADLQPWLKDAQINLDRNLRLQYLAGLGVDANDDDKIYKAILAYRTFPQNLFTGSDTMTLRRSFVSPNMSRMKSNNYVLNDNLARLGLCILPLIFVIIKSDKFLADVKGTPQYFSRDFDAGKRNLSDSILLFSMRSPSLLSDKRYSNLYATCWGEEGGMYASDPISAIVFAKVVGS